MVIHATYENGVFRPTEPVDLPEHTPVTVLPMNAVVSLPENPMTAEELKQLRASLPSFPLDPVEWQRRMRDEEWL